LVRLPSKSGIASSSDPVGVRWDLQCMQAIDDQFISQSMDLLCIVPGFASNSCHKLLCMLLLVSVSNLSLL